MASKYALVEVMAETRDEEKDFTDLQDTNPRDVRAITPHRRNLELSGGRQAIRGKKTSKVCLREQ